MHWKDSLPDWYVKKYGHQPCVNIGTAGHVDHGKTSLIQALTGKWTSVHSQELKRGITIRVGYSDAAFYKCPDCEPPTNYSTSPKCPNCKQEGELSRVVSFVDSPGHESLMANMLSGSALIDCANLLFSSNEKFRIGVMDPTGKNPNPFTKQPYSEQYKYTAETGDGKSIANKDEKEIKALYEKRKEKGWAHGTVYKLSLIHI